MIRSSTARRFRQHQSGKIRVYISICNSWREQPRLTGPAAIPRRAVVILRQSGRGAPEGTDVL